MRLGVRNIVRNSYKTLSWITADSGLLPNGASPVTKTGLNIGTEFATRRVVCLIAMNDNNTFTDIKFNGVSGTIHVQRATGGVCATCIASLIVPTGTTVDIEVTSSASNFNNAATCVAVLTFNDTLPLSSTPVTASAVATSSPATANTYVQGGALYCAVGASENTFDAGAVRTISADQTLTTAAPSGGNGKSRYGYAVIAGPDANFDGVWATTASAGGVILSECLAVWR